MSESQQLLRQWQLLQSLSNSRIGIALADLTAELAVTDRTIRRDLAVLQSAGFPLIEIVGDHGRKRWRMQPLSEQLSFSYSDMFAVILSRRFLEPLAGSPFWEGHQKIYQKVRGALGEHAVRFCERAQQIIRISGFGSGDYSKRGRIIDTLLQAMEDKQRVLVVYQSMQATEPVEQELGPQGLIWHNGSLYLIAWSARREQIRNYKIDRIESAELGSDLRYVVPENFSLEEWQRKAFGVFRDDGTDSHHVRIRFHRDAVRYVQESWWHDSQQFFAQKDGSVEMTLELTELTAVMKWILSFGRNATALGPPELIELMREEITAMLAPYENVVQR
ncbi:MAG: WYL domain-containing transcriptional regulator [Planctomycetaceae bacterium]|nr:WYL domain-containing transcriptional regulator [Planctomycetaceae bacterium]